MIKITSSFGSRKFAKDLEKKAYVYAENQVRSKLRDLVARGLRIRTGPSHPSRFNLNLEGPEELIDEARRRLG